jgi:ubiquinone/menaquinone biosynthesis C-methylase UbiE
MEEMAGRNGKVISVDVQDEMLDMSRQKSEKAMLWSRTVFHKAQLDKIGILEKVDFTLVFHMFHEVHDKERFLREGASLLKPDGKFLIVEPNFHVSKSQSRIPSRSPNQA